MRYPKRATTVLEQLVLWQQRGLQVPDPSRAIHYLSNVGYFRLCGYALPFQDPNPSLPPHTFRDGSSFNDILDLYFFDRKLRLLLLDPIDRVEVSVRTSICNTMNLLHGPHWYLKERLFSSTRFNHAGFLRDVENEVKGSRPDPTKTPQHQFIHHYFSTYTEPSLPPSWMIAEVLSFGKWSRVFSALADTQARQQIAGQYELHDNHMAQWLHALSTLRNLCAHHARVWNRVFGVRPMMVNAYRAQLKDNRHVYAFCVVLQVFMNRAAPRSRWKHRVLDLLQNHPGIPLEKMGFPKGWEQGSFWNFS